MISNLNCGKYLFQFTFIYTTAKKTDGNMYPSSYFKLKKIAINCSKQQNKKKSRKHDANVKKPYLVKGKSF